MTMPSLVELAGVTYGYGGYPAVEDVSLRIERGEFFGIIGPNGSGKTTLLKLMLGLLTPPRGVVSLFGVPPVTFRDWRRVGYVPQRITLDATLPMTVGEVVAGGLVSTLWPLERIGPQRRQQVREALALAGMEKHAAERIGRLSTGQQQRVLIARALVTHPELLVLDEPTGGVDPEAQRNLYHLLHQLHVEGGVTVVLVSHDIGIVAKEVTRLACLNGSMLFCGAPAGFLGHEFLTQLYGAPVRVIPHQDPCPHAS
jgi:zinc transport system ATP-binding protein